jgi:preprotein translocase subunit YajC
MGETVQSVVAQAGGGFDASFLIMMVAMFAIVYFLMIRPQRKQQQEHQALLGALKKGDEIVLSSGIMGKIFAIEDRVVTLEIGQSTRIRVLKTAVSGPSSRVLGAPEKAKALDDPKKDLKPDEDSGEAAADSDEKSVKKGKKKSA